LKIHRRTQKKPATAGKMAGKFEPKEAIELAPPKDDLIAQDYLQKCDGMLCFRSKQEETDKI